MLFLLLATALLVDPPPVRLLSDDVSAGLGVLGVGTATFGSRWGDALLVPTLTGRGVFGGFVVDAGLLAATPVTPGGTSFSLNGSLRVGYSGQRWAAVVGAVGQWAQDAQPALQWVPSLRAQVDFGGAGLSLGLFDWQGLVPAHLSLELATHGGHFSIGWAALVGLLASADLPLSGTVGLRVSGFAFRLLSAELAMLTVAVTWGGGR